MSSTNLDMSSTKLAFITGITGQDGSYLSELLLEKSYKVYGIIRRNSFLFNNTRMANIENKVNLMYGDMSDGSGLSNVLHKIINENPEYKILEIYNLAAQSHVAVSFEVPEYTGSVDGFGVLKLLECIKTLPETDKKKIKFYQAGTSELYGEVLETPQTEKTPFNPVSPYAAAKLYAYHIVKIYREAYGMFATNGILFNHESPRRGANFVTMKIVNGVKDIVANKKECIYLGNLNSKRDWGHAKDYVKGMWLMLQQDKPDDFVLATGETYTIRSFVEIAFVFKGFTITWKGEGIDEIGVDQNDVVRIRVSKKYFRPCEVDLLLGDASKAKEKLGWEREYDTLFKLIVDMFN